jgi:hypothetical protein
MHSVGILCKHGMKTKGPHPWPNTQSTPGVRKGQGGHQSRDKTPRNTESRPLASVPLAADLSVSSQRWALEPH